MPRCVIDVFDQTTHRERKCLHNRKWGNICSSHARKYIVKIQAAWKAYSTKKRVNLFKTLPEDAWKHILDFIILRNNTAKLLESHLNMYTKKIIQTKCNYRWPYTISYSEYNRILKIYSDNKDYIIKILKTY